MATLAQNEMKAKGDMPEHVSSNEGLGLLVRLGIDLVKAVYVRRLNSPMVASTLPRCKCFCQTSMGESVTELLILNVGILERCRVIFFQEELNQCCFRFLVRDLVVLNSRCCDSELQANWAESLFHLFQPLTVRIYALPQSTFTNVESRRNAVWVLDAELCGYAYGIDTSAQILLVDARILKLLEDYCPCVGSLEFDP